MAKQDDQTVLKLWKAGEPLKTSWITYMHPDLKPKWKAAREKSASDAYDQGAAAVAELENASVSEKVTLLFSGVQTILGERGTLKTELRATILRYIETGVLFGYGFEPPRSLNSTPVEIPKSLWRGKCNWDASTLEAQGLKFIEIRLTVAHIRNDILGRGNVDTTPTSATGRPSLGPAIKAAFHALNKAGEINVRLSQSSHYPKVRGWLELNYPNLSVSPASISNNSLQKHFSSLFNELVRNHKL